MRSFAVSLLLVGAVLAQDEFDQRLRVFEAARKDTLEPDAEARVNPAVEALVDSGDVRAVAPLSGYLAETFAIEKEFFLRLLAAQKRNADAMESSQETEREIQFLRLKEKAGDKTVGPEIEKRVREQAQQMKVFRESSAETARYKKALTFVTELREKLAVGAVQVLKGLSGEQVAPGLTAVRHALDVANRDQALFLVRLLGGSAQAEAETHLLDILASPGADDAVVRAAQYAIVPIMTRRGAEALLQIWEKDPDGRGRHARHALGLAARRKLESLDDARTWVASLG